MSPHVEQVLSVHSTLPSDLPPPGAQNQARSPRLQFAASLLQTYSVKIDTISAGKSR